MYKVQVEKDHYQIGGYDSESRFLSYFIQKDLVRKSAEEFNTPRILEIGKGNGFLSEYLARNGFTIKTMDIDPDLKPDYVGDINLIQDIVKERFDIIACFEVLEHIRYDNIPSIFQKLASMNPKYIIISVPQARLYLSFWVKMNLFRPFQKYFSIPFPVKHNFDGEHYWELGKRGYSLKNFRAILTKEFAIQKEFTNPLDPYHRFFVLLNKSFKDV